MTPKRWNRNSEPGAVKSDRPVLHADQQTRRRLLLFLVLAVLAGWFIIDAFQARMAGVVELARQDPEAALTQAARIFRMLMTVMAVTLSLLGLYMIQLAIRTIRWLQFPPPGVRVVRDTPLTVGEKARKRGKIILAVAVLLILTGIIGPYLAYTRFTTAFTVHTMPDAPDTDVSDAFPGPA